MEVEQPKVAAHEFQTTIGGQILLDKLNGQICLDDTTQHRYSQAHYRGSLYIASSMSMLSLYTTREAFVFPSVCVEWWILISD